MRSAPTELLDLTVHGVEDFEDKVVVVHGSEYHVDRYLGAGIARIVHLLRNPRSGLSLHVIKIERDPLAGHVDAAAATLEPLVREPRLSTIIPDLLIVAIPGGRVEVQVYGGGKDIADDPFGDHLDEAQLAVSTERWAEAAEVYRRVLVENSSHTFALNNLAFCKDRMGDVSAAIEYSGRAVTIEPIYRPYRLANASLLEKAGHRRAALDSMESVRTLWPYRHEHDGWVVDLYCGVGRPDLAAALVAEERQKAPDDDNLAETERKVRAAVESKARADALFEQARDALIPGSRDTVKQGPDRDRTVTTLLERACDEYGDDPYIRADLGLALRRVGDYASSADHLVWASFVINNELVPSCLANAAFSCILADDLSPAAALLETVEGLLPPDARSVADLPGVGGWFDPDGWVVEEPPSTAEGLLSRVASMSPSAARLADAYRRAAESMAE